MNRILLQHEIDKLLAHCVIKHDNNNINLAKVLWEYRASDYSTLDYQNISMASIDIVASMHNCNLVLTHTSRAVCGVSACLQ